jgi:MerR family mercuric resistance operon transcriptional regulator
MHATAGELARLCIIITLMHISQMARSAGVNVQTIRFYERQRLLRKPLRNASGYRCYEPGDLERVSFIKGSQALGFTLAEIKELIDLHKAVAAARGPIRRKPQELRQIMRMAAERLRSIDEKLCALHQMKQQLSALLEGLNARTIPVCPASATPLGGTRAPRRASPGSGAPKKSS